MLHDKSCLALHTEAKFVSANPSENQILQIAFKNMLNIWNFISMVHMKVQFWYSEIAVFDFTDFVYENVKFIIVSVYGNEKSSVIWKTRAKHRRNNFGLRGQAWNGLGILLGHF